MSNFRDNFKHALRPRQPWIHVRRDRCVGRSVSASTLRFSLWSIRSSSRLLTRTRIAVHGSTSAPRPRAMAPPHLSLSSCFGNNRPVFQDVAAYDFGGPGFNLTGAQPEQVRTASMLPGMLPVSRRIGSLGAPPQKAARWSC